MPKYSTISQLSVQEVDKLVLNTRKMPNGCIEWQRCRVHGYGQMWCAAADTMVRTHRLAYELFFGLISRGLFVCHHCDNPACCNPFHLFLGTVADNSLDRDIKGRGVNPRGEQHGNSVLTVELVNEIRALYVPRKTSQRKLAKRFGVSRGAVQAILEGKNWREDMDE